jgi:hypothetical protein
MNPKNRPGSLSYIMAHPRGKEKCIYKNGEKEKDKKVKDSTNKRC